MIPKKPIAHAVSWDFMGFLWFCAPLNIEGAGLIAEFESAGVGELNSVGLVWLVSSKWLGGFYQ